MEGLILEAESGDFLGKHRGILVLHNWSTSRLRPLRRTLVCCRKRC
ncbi:unnamed protein product [Rhodiola kirilowii]